MQIIHSKKSSVPVSTGTSKVDRLLKMPLDSISEGVANLSNFQLVGMTPDHLVLACYACLCVSHTMSVNMLTSSTSTKMTGLVVPPFFKSLDPPLYLYIGSLNFTCIQKDLHHLLVMMLPLWPHVLFHIQYVYLAQFPYMRYHI